MTLKNSLYALGISALSLLPIKSDAGTLSGKVTDMFSDAPYSNAVVTLVNEETGEVFKTRTLEEVTAVEQVSWGLVKRMINGGLNGRHKKASLESGFYSIDLPDGVYTMAIIDEVLPSAKPTSQDLFSSQFDPAKNLFVPRVFRVRVNGSTEYHETVLPKDFDLEFAWTVLSGVVEKYDPTKMTFKVYTGPARKKHREDPDGKEPQQWEVDNVISSIEEFIKLWTDGKVAPIIELTREFPEYVPKPKNIGSGVGMMPPEGTALFFWDSGLNPGVAGTGVPFVNNETGGIVSSDAQYTPNMTEKVVALNEVLGSAGLHGEPGTKVELDQRIVNSGGSIFLDAHGNPGFITERDAQIIKYHGARPLGTKAPDITERVVNE